MFFSEVSREGHVWWLRSYVVREFFFGTGFVLGFEVKVEERE